MRNSNYQKKCPCCKKEFRARRLNQIYCTLFCKTQFNNAKAKARRLELIEISEKYQAKQVENFQEKLEVETSPTLSLNDKPKEKIRVFPNFISSYKILAPLVILILFSYFIYKSLYLKKIPSIPPEDLLKSQMAKYDQPENSSKTFVSNTEEAKQKVSFQLPEKIPIEVKKIDQNLKTSSVPEKHPDIIAYEKLLSNRNKT